MSKLSDCEIDVSPLLASNSFDPWNCSNSVANLGPCAGRLTWEASKQSASSLVLSPEQAEAFRCFVRSSGGWAQEEISAWDETELTALCVQWISGDIRECFGDDLPDEPAEWDWVAYEEGAEAGCHSSRFYLSEGRLLWSCAE